jgi:hypothetical protein
VFALNSKHRALITRRAGARAAVNNKHSLHPDNKSPAERHAAMIWVQRLRRVFGIDIEACDKCQGLLRANVRIEEPLVIQHILEPMNKKKSVDTQA